MKLLSTALFILLSIYYSISARAVTLQPKASETRKASAQVSKSLYAKLKSQALNEARAELALQEEARERAKLEALKELEAGVTAQPENAE